MEHLPDDWKAVLAPEFEKPYFKELQRYVAGERDAGPVYPVASHVFAAFQSTPFESVKVVIIGQDPYHGEGEAHGLCFSVPPGVRKPPSLANIFKELKADLGCELPADGSLVGWAERGVLLLNTTLTVRADQANSHKGRGWETLTGGPNPLCFYCGDQARASLHPVSTRPNTAWWKAFILRLCPPIEDFSEAGHLRL